MCAFVGDADVVVGEAGPIPWKKWEDVGFVCGAMELATNSWLPFTERHCQGWDWGMNGVTKLLVLSVHPKIC